MNPTPSKRAASFLVCNCGQRTVSLVQGHCPTCHRQFSTVAAFDKHRQVIPRREGGDGVGRRCLDPATILELDGTPVFSASEERYGVVWRMVGSKPSDLGDGE